MTCTFKGCEEDVEVEGHNEELHGPVLCSEHQPRCSECGEFTFNGTCPECSPERWEELKAGAL